MIEGQGGDPRVAEDVSLLPQARYNRVLTASQSGWIAAMDSEEIGRASVALGAGRMQKTDAVDPAAGIVLAAKYGDEIRKGEPLMTIYGAKPSQLDEAEQMLRTSVKITAEQPSARPLIRAVYSNHATV